jgi:alpha-glucosidase
VLNLTRDLIALRKRTPDLQLGAYHPVKSPAGVWAWRRGESVLVALNMQDSEAALEMVGTVAVDTTRRREGERLEGRLELLPWEGVVLIGARIESQQPAAAN